MPPRARRDDPREEALLAKLAEVYRDADALHAGWSCPASTECCRFGITGREPWVTSIEERALERALAARGGPLSAASRALPIAPDEGTCPMLDRGGRCAVYAARPLGCRTFYCGRASPGAKVSRGDHTALVRRVQEIAAAHVQGGDKPRPLGRLLARRR